MEKPNRRQNRLPDYDYAQAGSYFITLCTKHRAQLFTMEPAAGNDRSAVPEGYANQVIHYWLKETQNKFPNITIDRYVIMPDHLHLIITILEASSGCSIPEIMQFFKAMTTNDYIRNVKAGLLRPFKGHLWQKSYYDHIIRNQKDYNEIWEYINNNPAKWMMTHTP